MLNTQQQFNLQNQLRKRLNTINQQLENGDHFGLERAHSHQSVGELSNYDNHPGDTGTELYEREKDIALNEHIEQEKKEILQSLERINKGTYGKCAVCHQPIPYQRLEILPTATCCVKHSKDQELSKDRPIEETVLNSPYQFFNDKDDEFAFFDGEDAFQILQRYGTSETPSDFFAHDIADYNDLTIELSEEVVGAEDLENFVGTDIEGRNLTVYPTSEHEKYERMIDEDNQQYLEELGFDLSDFE